LDIPGVDLPLTDALQLRGEEILGSRHYAAYGADFPILVKILDPGKTIGFHFHARDVDVWKHPRRFGGQRFGKDEAYYFLDAPRGPIPYTHVGLVPGTTPRILADAIASGGGRVLELSPVVYQKIGTGFFVPAGVPHRPGTALTLEVQQPSDVSTMLERESGGRALSEREMYPGFSSLHDALAFVDYATACDPALLRRYQLTPEPARDAPKSGGREEWIFPPRLRKFSGKRLVVHRRYESQEDGPYLALVWRGRGRVNGVRVRAGTEFFVIASVAAQRHLYEAEGDPMEVFKFFSPAPAHYHQSPLSR
jgi:mannose-6-phosphate isomerase class I